MAVVRLELHQAAQRAQAFGLVVDELGVLLERRVAAAASRVLELGDRERVEEVVLAIDAVLDVSACAELLVIDRPVGRIRPVLAHLDFAGDHVDADAADAGRRPGEVLVDEVLIQPQRLEDLSAVVALNGADAHLGDYFDDALGDGLAVLLLGHLPGAGDQAQADLVVDGLEGEVRVDGAGAVPKQEGKVMDFARLAGFEDEARQGAGAGPDEVMVDGRDGEERRHGGFVGVVAAIREDDDVVAFSDRLRRAVAEGFDGLAEAGSAVADAVQGRQRDRLEAVRVGSA